MARTPTPNTGAATSTTETTGSQESQTSTSTENTGDATDGAASGDDDPDEMVEARVTLEFEDYAVNEVAEFSAGRVGQLEREGYIDTHADAVAYAKSLAA